MPENVASRSGAPAAGPGSRGKGAYQDRDKPAQIRFSNISAAKGITLSPAGLRRCGPTSHCDLGPGWVVFLQGGLIGSFLLSPPSMEASDTPHCGTRCSLVHLL